MVAPLSRVRLSPGRTLRLALALSSALSWSACTGGDGSPPPKCDKSDVVCASAASALDRIEIDVYVDATSSMQGFTASPQSRYVRFLDELEAAIGAGWRQTDVKYFKFGSVLKEIRREEYLTARGAAFYTEKGILEATNIDSVVSRTNVSRISALITDLFQNQGDVNAIVAKVKEKCFLKGVSVAVLALPSQFSGKVFDAGVPPYEYVSKGGDERTYRPFYTLLFGNPHNILRLFESLETRRLASRVNFLLIAPCLVRDYTVMRLEKSKNSHGLNQMGKGQPDFMLKSDSSSGAFEADLDVDLYPLTPTIRPDRLELLTYRRPAAEKKPPNAMPSLTEQSSDFSLKALALEGRKMSLLLDFKTNASPGKYLYTVYVRVPSLNVFATPQWAKDFSSANPTPAKDPNKTLNLEKFITDLLSASVAVRQPNVVKLCLTIDRR